jgi:hypothetical protein
MDIFWTILDYLAIGMGAAILLLLIACGVIYFFIPNRQR